MYAPWRAGQAFSDYGAGEIIAIRKGAFNYRSWSSIEDRSSAPLYAGTLVLLKDRIFLDHPEVAFPYRVSGMADGVSVLLKWRGFEDWKRTHTLLPSDILYLQDLRLIEPNKEPTTTAARDRGR